MGRRRTSLLFPGPLSSGLSPLSRLFELILLAVLMIDAIITPILEVSTVRLRGFKFQSLELVKQKSVLLVYVLTDAHYLCFHVHASAHTCAQSRTGVHVQTHTLSHAHFHILTA